MKRRRFLYQSALAAGGILLDPLTVWSDTSTRQHKLTILHTNDVHSRMDPFPASAGNLAGLGGVARRSARIRAIRETEPQVLLFDSGDMLQGTPYFNFFQGDVEFEAMNAMSYDAATIGNHDFDGGLGLLKRQIPSLDFPLLSANYDFSQTELAGMVAPWKVLSRGPLRIGVFGLGVELKGLVPPELYGATSYLDPLEKANRVSRHLRQEEGCHLIICLSHLGYHYNKENKVSDRILAGSSRDIDLILGGHTHTFLRQPVVLLNAAGHPVLIAQTGWGGVILGRIDIWFDQSFRRRQMQSRPLTLDH
jgi:5'-nucleotidase